MSLIRFFHLPFLFWLPLYFTWQASGVIQQANNSCSEYRQWLGEPQYSTELPILHTTDTEAHSEDIDSESTSSSPPSVPCFQPKSMPESLLKMRTTWNTFVDSRLDEWKIAITFAGVLVACVLPKLIYIPELTICISCEAHPLRSFRSPKRPMTHLRVPSRL